MIQRISVRVRVISGNRVLLMRRADGRDSILGKYELPGGRIKGQEQPESTAKRYLASHAGIERTVHLQLEDVITYIDKDDRNIQYAVIVYRAVIGKTKRLIKPTGRYDKYVWYTFGRIDLSEMTDVSRQVLGASPLPVAESVILPEKPRNSEQGVVVYTDGGSRGNPGPSAAGYVIIDRGEIIDQGGEYLGITTNNLAEYHGVKLALESALRLGIDSVELRADSMLVVNQLNGIYKIKNRELWPVNELIRELIGQFKKIKFTYVPREMNQLADGMVNRTLNRRRSMQRKIGHGVSRSMV